MKKGKTHVTFVLDRSGSMASVWSDVEGGYKSLIEDQQKESGECTFSLYAFDDSFDTIELFTEIKKVKAELNVKPRGMTSLYDAIGKAINETGEKLASLPESERPEKVMVYIQTDGQENSSREFTGKRVKEMIKLQNETYNWQFNFLGADDACLKQAESLGINQAYYATYGSGEGMTKGISQKMSAVRSASAENLAATASLSDDDRTLLDS